MKAIETKYKGYRFRSRLEARWAVFFDAIGLSWEYEPEGFEFVDGTRYLPDFWIPAYRLFVEVKPFAALPSEEKKASALLFETGCAVFLAHGAPWEWGTLHFSYTSISGEYNEQAYRAFLDLACDAVRLKAAAEEPGQHDHQKLVITGGSRMPRDWRDRYEHAFCAARSARFEFGECGAPA